MPTTIYKSFQKLKNNLEITSLQESIVSNRQKAVRKVVEADFNILNSFLTGSYSRHTMIAPLKKADVDIFMVLDPSYYEENGQPKLLDKVKNTLKKEYPKTPKISRNRQAITITFSDFIVDVIPAFYRRGGGFLIPSTIGNQWISTDPRKHVEIFANANREHEGDLVPLIKMIKAWNRSIDQFFNSFHLEVLALDILNNVNINNFHSGMRYYFDHGRAKVKVQNLDPAGYSGDVGYYLNSKLSDAESRFETAYKRAIKAEEYEKKGKTSDAVNEWKKIFGSSFPSYG